MKTTKMHNELYFKAEAIKFLIWLSKIIPDKQEKYDDLNTSDHHDIAFDKLPDNEYLDDIIEQYMISMLPSQDMIKSKDRRQQVDYLSSVIKSGLSLMREDKCTNK